MTEPSLYEHLNPLCVVAKQRFVEHFDGDTLCTDRWTTRNTSGAGATFIMQNAVDQGFIISSPNPGDSNDGGEIDFNSIHHYNDCGSVAIGVIQPVQSTCNIVAILLQNCVNLLGHHIFGGMLTNSCACNYLLRTSAGTPGFTATTTAVSTNFQLHKIEMLACCAEYTVDGGCVCITRSCTLPTNALQPTFFVQQQVAALRQGRIRYFEAYNT